VQFIVFLVAYCIAGKLGQATTNIRSSNLGPVWPAYGIALAAFLVCGNRIWPAIASGAFLVAFFSPVSHLAALGQAAGSTLAASSGSFLLRRIARFDNSLSRLHDALALVLLGGSSALVSATIGISVLYATHVHAYSGLGSAWVIYWLGDATGVLLVTPVVLTLPRFLRSRVRGRITELTILFVVLSAACFLIFGDPSLIPVSLHVLAFAVLPFGIWAAIRFGVTGAGLSILLIATFATIETALGSGPFATNTTFINAVLLDAFFAVLSVTGLTLASAIAEREQAQNEREQSVREQAVLEVRLETEQVIRASEERLRLAQQAAHIGTFERDVRTGRITWTEGLEALYGLPPGSLEGKTIAFFKDLIHPADFERAVHVIEKALKTGQPTECEWRAIWPDGSVHWIAARWRVLMDRSGQPVQVLGVNMDVTERKQAEQGLHAREELLKTFVKTVPAAVAMLDRDMRYLQVSDRWCTDYLPGTAQIIGRSHYEIFPDMPERWKEVHRRALEGETLRADEDRWDGQGGPHWARWEVRPWNTAEGTVGGILILAEDITLRKQMEEALTGIGRKLIAAQEQERARIGRELHDDIAQRLALLAIELQQLQENPSEMQERVQALRKRTSEIANDVQALSHELHSSKLEYLGAVAGIKSWCREFGERQGVEIKFKADVDSAIPSEIGVTLLRILQEALQNAVKHSGVKRLEVELSEQSNEIHLKISDAGKGFEIEEARQSRGLGLASMEERVRLVKGAIAFDSKPMGGTTIRVRIPLKSEPVPQRQAV
jgi:PAS domain S-box-containing protein